jgi:hypothetical protein
MTDEQIEAAIEAIQGMLAAKAVSDPAKVIEAVAEPAALPAPPARKRRKAVKKQAGLGADVGSDVGTHSDVANMPMISTEILQMDPKAASMFAFSRPSCKTDARC